MAIPINNLQQIAAGVSVSLNKRASIEGLGTLDVSIDQDAMFITDGKKTYKFPKHDRHGYKESGWGYGITKKQVIDIVESFKK